MTPEYRVRRNAKHVAQAENKITTADSKMGTIDLTPRTPRLSWLTGKLFKQNQGVRKNNSGHRPEQIWANEDNKNPYKSGDLWYWYDETELACETGYVTREQAEIALNEYGKWLSSPKEVTAEPMPVSIGGIDENMGLSGSDADPISN